MKAITLRQQEVLLYIQQFIVERGFSPTVREISEWLAISVRVSYDRIKALERKGYIKCDSRRARSIRVTQSPGADRLMICHLPLLGKVAAGTPLLVEENCERMIQVPNSWIGSGSYFAVTVAGRSMCNVGILDGDIAILRKQEQAENGEIVLAAVNEGTTLKRFFRELHRVRLQPENPEYPAIFSREVRIIGRLIRIFRSYD